MLWLPNGIWLQNPLLTPVSKQRLKMYIVPDLSLAFSSPFVLGKLLTHSNLQEGVAVHVHSVHCTANLEDSQGG